MGGWSPRLAKMPPSRRMCPGRMRNWILEVPPGHCHACGVTQPPGSFPSSLMEAVKSLLQEGTVLGYGVYPLLHSCGTPYAPPECILPDVVSFRCEIKGPVRDVGRARVSPAHWRSPGRATLGPASSLCAGEPSPAGHPCLPSPVVVRLVHKPPPFPGPHYFPTLSLLPV